MEITKSEDCLIFYGLTPKISKKKLIHNGLLEFMKEKQAIDPSDRFNLILFNKDGPNYLEHFTFDPNLILKTLKSLERSMVKANIASGIFVATTFIIEVFKRITEKLFRLLILIDNETDDVPSQFMPVLENLLVAPHRQTGEKFFNIFLRRKRIKEEEQRNVLKALEILEFLEITHIRDQLGEELSGGQLKLLALGRLLMSAPRLILLDEPMAGINPTLGNKIMDKILDLKENSTIFLTEHNMDVVFSYSDEIFVMARGKIIAQGTPNEIETNREVIEAYLGKDY